VTEFHRSMPTVTAAMM